MISTIIQSSKSFSLPKLNSTEPLVRYDFTEGYGGQVPIGRNLQGASYNANLSAGFTSSDYKPNEYAGVLHFNNPSCDGTASATPYSMTVNTPNVNNYSFFMGFTLEAILGGSCGGSEIFTGSYDGNAHDWWCGLNGGQLVFSRNGNTLSTGIYPTVGNRYIIGGSNYYIASGGSSGSSGTSGTAGTGGATGYGVICIWGTDGTSYTTTDNIGRPASTAGILGIGKYGGYLNTFLVRIKLGHYHYWSSEALVISNFTNLKNQYKAKYGITV